MARCGLRLSPMDGVTRGRGKLASGDRLSLRQNKREADIPMWVGCVGEPTRLGGPTKRSGRSDGLNGEVSPDQRED
jgi:hypothetical protein